MYANEPAMARRWEKHTPKGKLPERVGKMSDPGHEEGDEGIALHPHELVKEAEIGQQAPDAEATHNAMTKRGGKAAGQTPMGYEGMSGKAGPTLEGGFSTSEVQRAIERLGKRPPFALSTIREGMNVEREHADVTKDAVSILKIALAHLRETPSYYRKLKKLEGKMVGKMRASFEVKKPSEPSAGPGTGGYQGRSTYTTDGGTFTGTSGVPASKRSPWPDWYRADRAPPNPYPGRASRNPTPIQMTGHLKYATPAGPVKVPSDRAGLRGRMMHVVNGKDLVAKLRHDPEMENGRLSGPDTLRYEVATDKRVSPSEALYQSPEERTAGPKELRCRRCEHFERDGAKHTGKCNALACPINPRNRASVHANGYCMLFRAAEHAVKSLLIRPLRSISTTTLSKKIPHVAQIPGSAPRWETPPIPDYQEIYHQPESDSRKRLERQQADVRRRANAYRNKGVFGFHGTALASKPELRYEPDETLSNPSVQAPKRPGNREPVLTAPKLLARISAGTPKEESLYGSSGATRKKKKRRLVARIR